MKFSGWGNYPCIEANGFSFETVSQLKKYLTKPGDCIPYGLGRSYGDSALNKSVVLSRRMDKVIGFDAEKGIVTCESGVSLADLIEIFLPMGWFLSITPGTKFVTVGGAIASDVHGKNHHTAGCFSESVISFDLMLGNGEIVQCSRKDNSELFLATCGGMGLTGIILSAVIKLQSVSSSWIRETIIPCCNLEESFSYFEENCSVTYSVAWIDCLAKGKNTGRSILMLGEHAQIGGLLSPSVKPSFSIPTNLPGFCLNTYSISAFNWLYYRKNSVSTEDRFVSLDSFFYPLDAIGQWYHMYGSGGFTQYQIVLPKESSFHGLQEILRRIALSGMGSFLAVLKLFGPNNENYLSFPIKGYTLALDFKITKKLFPLLDELDLIVLDHGGRVYLTKDVRMKRDVFIKGYSDWEKFYKVRKKYGMTKKFNSLQSKRIGI